MKFGVDELLHSSTTSRANRFATTSAAFTTGATSVGVTVM